MFYSETTIGAFTVIFYASSFTNARTRQKAPKKPTHFIIYSIAKGKEYYIPNNTKKDQEFKNKILLNTHAFFRDEDEEPYRDGRSYMASLVTNDKMEENSDLMDQLTEELRRRHLPKTPLLRRRSSSLLRRRSSSLPRTPSPSLRRRSSLLRTPSLSVRRRHSLPRTPSQYKKIIEKSSFIIKRK